MPVTGIEPLVYGVGDVAASTRFFANFGLSPVASHLGLGRHRIDSALFYYIPCPAGKAAEYRADSDYVDENWVPRDWINPLFGFAYFAHNLPPFLQDSLSWDFRYMTEEVAAAGGGHS